jgi:hypothetical protein
MSWTAERARYASLTRSRPADDPDLLAARRALRVERATDYIADLVTAVQLTDAEINRLTVLLRGAERPVGGAR